MSKNINCFILAAGLGERLRPITNHIPKPLLPIMGKPLIESLIEKFSLISSGKIGINLHYKADMLRDWAMNSAFSERIELFYEDPILGTGGALKNAGGFFSGGYFLAHNSDILSDIDFSLLIEKHLSEGNIATLAAHDYPKYNNVVLDDKGYVIDVENPGTSIPNPDTTGRKVAYTGIAVYSDEILKFLPEGVSHATVAWLAAAKAGYKVKAMDFTGCCWTDIGTPAAYASAVINALKSEGETVYISPYADGCSYAGLDGYIILEGKSVVGRDAYLRNCIVLPNSFVPPLEKGDAGGFSYENCIIGQDFHVKLSESDMGLTVEDGSVLIGTGGSDRKYFRVRDNEKTVVLMQCASHDPDFQRHIEYTGFFRKYSIPVPEMTGVEPGRMNAFFEDLGDMSLYNWLKCRRDEDKIEDIYRHIMDILILLHTVATEHVSECPLLGERIFDYEHLRWETGYFIERYVKGVRNIAADAPSALELEFHRLALKVDSFPKTVVHRDFQSQNIMVQKGALRLIDYQGARIGPPAYDVASILWDPYCRLNENMRERLIQYYVEGIKAAVGGKFDEHGFSASVLPCRLQRHMQALGAYGFLSIVKGKKYFLRHAAEGLRLLKEDALPAKEEYPELYELVMRL